MKKVKTFNDLQKHPLVKGIDCEYQSAVYDESDYVYYLYLIDGKKFRCENSTMISAPSKQSLISYFNCYEIISI